MDVIISQVKHILCTLESSGIHRDLGVSSFRVHKTTDNNIKLYLCDFSCSKPDAKETDNMSTFYNGMSCFLYAMVHVAGMTFPEKYDRVFNDKIEPIFAIKDMNDRDYKHTVELFLAA